MLSTRQHNPQATAERSVPLSKLPQMPNQSTIIRNYYDDLLRDLLPSPVDSCSLVWFRSVPGTLMLRLSCFCRQ
eukprot:scaffold13706_cov15-Tisochrysis_lutea.AAC.1